MPPSPEQGAIRRELRARRRSLDVEAQTNAALNVRDLVHQIPEIQSAKTLAFIGQSMANSALSPS